MVKINKIYTKVGDSGETYLVGGEKIAKSALRVECYGDVDELNAWIGWALTLATEANMPFLTEKLKLIQHELFDIGAELATPPGTSYPNMVVAEEAQISRLEGWIDSLIDGLPELRSFVLPGGSNLNSALHVARTVCRRAERRIVELNLSAPVNPALLRYVNRLSDLLFAMTRAEAHAAGRSEILWVPGKERLKN